MQLMMGRWKSVSSDAATSNWDSGEEGIRKGLSTFRRASGPGRAGGGHSCQHQLSSDSSGSRLERYWFLYRSSGVILCLVFLFPRATYLGHDNHPHKFRIYGLYFQAGSWSNPLFFHSLRAECMRASVSSRRPHPFSPRFPHSSGTSSCLALIRPGHAPLYLKHQS